MADLPWCQLEDRSAGNSLIQDRIKVLDAVIRDEASKSSGRMFEVVRFLHQKLATNEFNKALPFAGKQVTLVGEFLQFQPVPTSSMKENLCSILPCSTSPFHIILT